MKRCIIEFVYSLLADQSVQLSAEASVDLECRKALGEILKAMARDGAATLVFLYVLVGFGVVYLHSLAGWCIIAPYGMLGAVIGIIGVISAPKLVLKLVCALVSILLTSFHILAGGFWWEVPWLWLGLCVFPPLFSEWCSRTGEQLSSEKDPWECFSQVGPIPEEAGFFRQLPILKKALASAVMFVLAFGILISDVPLGMLIWKCRANAAAIEAIAYQKLENKRFEEAIRDLKIAVILESLCLDYGIKSTVHALGEAYLKASRWEDAEHIFRQSLKTTRKDSADAVSMSIDLALALEHQSKLHEARDLFLQALHIAEQKLNAKQEQALRRECSAVRCLSESNNTLPSDGVIIALREEIWDALCEQESIEAQAYDDMHGY